MKALARGLVVLLILARSGAAQSASLANRLDPETFAAISAIVDSAKQAKLPTKPLLDKAFEGAAKGSEGGRIVLAVQQLSARMGSAKVVLGARSPDEIKSAAGALEVGVSARDLARIRSATGRRRPMTMPLAVLTDLIGRQVPIATATDLVLQLSRSGMKDNDFALYQRNVRADIDRGADPAVAATTRARGFILRTANGGDKR
jgi:hypothetical protein